MKRLFIILLVLVLTGVIACDDKSKCDCSKDSVCVSIINSTGQPLETVTLLSRGINKATVGQLASDDKACLSFKSSGENTFSLTAILSNGKTLISREEYSEGGYKFIGTITKDEIKIEYNDTY